ncbi:MAG: class I SAM-dependent methyltransferase [Candidatus Methanofastidiosia archaeon]|jgi:ubiquinone/menaquinone biosynthesis C-methylase UbiE
MKKAPIFTPVPETPEQVKKYIKSAADREKKMGESLAQELVTVGFEKGYILDAGCGTGERTIELAETFPESKVVGLDLSQPLLEKAQKKAAHINNCTFQRGDVQAMPFEDDSFDVVININMLHVVEDPVAMLNEIERVLKPHGLLGLGDLKRSWMGYILTPLKKAYTAEEAKELLQQSNLRSWEFTETRFWFRVKTGNDE